MFFGKPTLYFCCCCCCLFLIAHIEVEVDPENPEVDPENPGDYEFICYGEFGGSHGKWMIFKHFDELRSTWRNIKRAKDEGRFDGSVYLKTSTKVYRPGSYGPGPCTTGVIEVYTKVGNRDSVGREVCKIVEHDIMYKTERATREGRYHGSGHSRPPSNETMLYNRGSPRLMGNEKQRKKLGYSREREDEWKLNIVMSLYTQDEMRRCSGKWVVPVTKGEATGVWHILRRRILKENQGILKMECPKCENKENFVIHVYTTKEDLESVGDDLQELMEREITYEFTDKQQKPITKEW